MRKTYPNPKVSIQGEKRKDTVIENKNCGFLLSLGMYGTRTPICKIHRESREAIPFNAQQEVRLLTKDVEGDDVDEEDIS